MAELSSFQTAAQRTDDQKRALLDAVAQAGTAGSNAYQNAQQQTQGLRQQAVGAALNAAGTSPLASIPGGTNAVTAPIEQNFAMRQADLAQGQATFGQDIARQQAAGEQYFGQLQGAIPIVEQRTKQAIEKILADERMQQEQNAIQLEMSRNNLAASREARAQAANGGSIRDQIAAAQEERARFCFDNPTDPKCLSSAELKAQREDEETAANAARGAFVTNALRTVRDTEGDRVGGIIIQAFRQTDMTPLDYIEKLLQDGQLETRGQADRGGVGKTHRQGALNYEYLRDRVAAIMEGADQAAKGPANVPTTSGAGGGYGD